MLQRTSRRVGWPTAAVIRRTCRLRPSVIVSLIQQSGTVLRMRTGGSRGQSAGGAIRSASAGRVIPSLSRTPSRSAASAASSISPSIWTRYVLGCLNRGIGDPRLEPAVVGEQEQPLAVEIEAARGIDAGHVEMVGQCRAALANGAVVGELAENAVRLVEQDQRHRRV